ncbi:hypothetical protein HDU98_004069 [Podochytrium sp. JEL0797]|nr:hypothetical protein HDU98_004069 [Podochytrium sp. JEL0797]
MQGLAPLIIINMTPPDTPALILTEIILYSLGFLLNGSVLAASLVARTNHKRTDVTLPLITLFFLWTLASAIINVLDALGGVHHFRWAAAFSSVMLVLIFAANQATSMRQYFQVKAHRYARPLFALFYVTEVSFIAVICWAFITSPASDGIQPDLPLQNHVWTITLISAFVSPACFTAWCYTRTYLLSRRQFAQHPKIVKYFSQDKSCDTEDDATTTDPETLDILRVNLERQILVKCVALSISMLVCYLPLFSYFLVASVARSMEGYDVWFYGGVVGVAVDGVVTPGLVLYFRRDVRRVLMGV